MREEEFLHDAMRNTVRNAVHDLLRSRDYSAKFLSRSDVPKIDAQVDQITDEITSKLISRLKEKGYLESGRSPDQGEFEGLFQSIIEEQFGNTQISH